MRTDQDYYDQQARDGFADGVRAGLADAGYVVVPAEDIEELRAHVEWGQGSPERMFEALRRISRVLEGEAALCIVPNEGGLPWRTRKVNP